MQKVSAIITTFNETEHIEGVVENLDFANEVLIVDSYSTDDTVAKAKSLGCKVLQHSYENPSKQKNWAIPQAKYPYVLLLDADERLTESLKQEIIEALKAPQYDAYWVYRSNFFMGKRLNYSGIQHDKVVRLIRRDACRYNKRNVHEEIEILPETKETYFKNRLEHYTYKNLNETLHKMNRYGDYQVHDYKDKTGHITAYHLVLKPFFRFFKHYVIGKGYKDGFAGYMFAYTQAYGVKIRYLKLKMYQKGIKG